MNIHYTSFVAVTGSNLHSRKYSTAYTTRWLGNPTRHRADKVTMVTHDPCARADYSYVSRALEFTLITGPSLHPALPLPLFSPPLSLHLPSHSLSLPPLRGRPLKDLNTASESEGALVSSTSGGGVRGEAQAEIEFGAF